MRKLAALILTAFFLSLPQLSHAAFSAQDSGLRETAGCGYNDCSALAEGNYNIANFVGFYVIQPVLGILGLLFLVLTIYAGFLWMTAAGEPKKVEKAKEILRTSIIGAVIILSAYALTNAVFNALTTGSFVGNPSE